MAGPRGCGFAVGQPEGTFELRSCPN